MFFAANKLIPFGPLRLRVEKDGHERYGVSIGEEGKSKKTSE
jgi:hypothetical protein